MPAKPNRLANALAMTGLDTEEQLIDMANVGSSLMNTIETYVTDDSPLQGWSPAEDPAEIVGDLVQMLEESLACHRQAMDQIRTMAEHPFIEGPFAYLVGHPDMSEDEWGIEDEPTTRKDEADGFWCRALYALAPFAVIETRAAEIRRLPVGTLVSKVTGYPFPGEIRSAFVTKAGDVRFVVEVTGAEYAGMIHIFNGDQLAAVTPADGEAR